MQTPKNLFVNKPNLPTIKTASRQTVNAGVLKDGEANDVNTSQIPTSVARKSSKFVSKYHQILVIQAMLAIVCEYNALNKESTQRLFRFMYKQLIELGVVSADAQLNEYQRRHSRNYYEGFKLLISQYNTASPIEGHIQVPEFLYSTKSNYALSKTVISCNGLSLNIPDYLPRSSRYEEEYEELEKLGSGGFGVVYKVRNRLDLMLYAIKRIKLKSFVNEELQKVQQEVRHLATLKHSNIVAYYNSWKEYSDEDLNNSFNTDEQFSYAYSSSRTGVSSSMEIQEVSMESVSEQGEVDNKVLSKLSVSAEKPKGKFWDASASTTTSYSDQSVVSCTQQNGPKLFLYIQMELCNSNLDQYLRKRNDQLSDCQVDKLTKIDEAYCECIMQQILKGVKFIHSKGLIHRDLKPSNIFLDESQKIVKIGDFGLARSIIDDQQESNGPLTPFENYVPDHYTAEIGTGTYAAPEQLKSSNYGQKADMYSVGIMYFEMYFPFGTGMERNEAITNLRDHFGQTLEVEAIKEKFPLVAKVIMDLVREDPAERPTAEDLLSITANPTDLKEELNLKIKYIKQLTKRMRAQDIQIHYLHRQNKQLRARLSVFERNRN
ncbi:Eukaryotic translation initiation factor 2-alpha kinase [Chamberlinius hualienensis]